jgi:uncharacterized protein (DUF58 family)
MSAALASRLSAWLARRHEREHAPVRLTQRRIFILPSRSGALLGLTLGLMLLGCINYNLGLGYVLTFLLAGVATVALLHTFRNLAQLELRPGRVEPVFLGEDATFPVLLTNATPQARFAVCIRLADSTGVSVPGAVVDWCDPDGHSTVIARLRLSAQARGRLHLPRLRIHTTFPLGLFYAWSNVYLDMDCVVYPRPEPGTVPPPRPAAGWGTGTLSVAGPDDFAGLRTYQPSDSPRHVAWKALARGQEMMTKQFVTAGAGELWLRWADLPGGMRVEARLSRLTRWVLDAAGTNLAFGLEIPGTRIPPDAGPQHEQRCLTALALFKARS